MGRWSVLIIVLLVLSGVGFAYGGNSQIVSSSIVQKPTDQPKDQPIKVVLHTGKEYCYSPVFSKGEGYVWIDKCGNQTAKARYDVFQRISYYINKTWLCVTAPESVVKGNADWGYVNLRPCTINNPLQRWIVRIESFGLQMRSTN